MKFSIPGLIALLILSTFQPGAADAPPRRTPETTADKEIELLPEVVVSASRVPLEARAVGSAVTVITAEEIERKQVRVVSDLLREVPGIAVNRSGPVGAVTQVRIRGTEANHTLVIIDGVEINDPSTGSEFYFDDLLAADIERIEVLRGPQSALYGSDAIGGVINITTKKGAWSRNRKLSFGRRFVRDRQCLSRHPRRQRPVPLFVCGNGFHDVRDISSARTRDKHGERRTPKPDL